MKLCKLIIKDFQQFKHLELDFTYPEGHSKAGEPLDKVCLIGRNGTGKTTILNLIFNCFNNKKETFVFNNLSVAALIIFKLKIDNDYVYLVNNMRKIGPSIGHIYKSEVDKITNWTDKLYNSTTRKELSSFTYSNEEQRELSLKIKFLNNKNNLLIYSQTEDNNFNNIFEGERLFYPDKNSNNFLDVQLNDALNYFKTFPFSHQISTTTISNFWLLLIYLIKKRENEYNQFANRPENIDNKTIRQVQEEFEKDNPKILYKIADLWNKILEKAGLIFDVENASNPIQLTDNLRVYIKLKRTGQIIPYENLSSGIRNFIFRLGHIYTLYFNRNIEKGFLLIDEPENSLFPDFLYDLVGIYQSIINNTQLFMATHNPIIAAQFEPYERIILDFDEKGYVVTHKGRTPVGDDPNDLLSKDFEVRNLLGQEGLKKWEEYVELTKQIALEQDKEKKRKLIDRYIEIGTTYNFPKNEIPKKAS